jgi:multicomponent Na+:H+ antiporter subunit G
MSSVFDVLVGLLLIGGAGFTLVAALGVLRMEDVFVRMHASTKAGTLGLLLVVLALLFNDSGAAIKEKGVALFLLVIATAPVGAHLVGRAVWRVMDGSQRDDCAPNPGDPDPYDSVPYDPIVPSEPAVKDS